MANEITHALRRIAKVSYGATVEEGKEVSKIQRGAADLIDQQDARMAELERILDGLPQDAINGGWTARGISAYAKKLESQIATLTDSSEMEKLRKNAARYEFLRAGFGDMGPEVDMHNAFVEGGEVMDSEIDRALAALQPKDAREAT